MAVLKCSSPRRRRRGNAMVEMALILPLLILFIFGIIEYGWMFYRISQINLAARHGVRVGVRPAAIQTEVEAAVAEVMNGAGWASDDYTVNTSVIAVPVGDPVKVSVFVDYDKVGFGLLPSSPPLQFTPATVSGTATMAKEGP